MGSCLVPSFVIAYLARPLPSSSDAPELPSLPLPRLPGPLGELFLSLGRLVLHLALSALLYRSTHVLIPYIVLRFLPSFLFEEPGQGACSRLCLYCPAQECHLDTCRWHSISQALLYHWNQRVYLFSCHFSCHEACSQAHHRRIFFCLHKLLHPPDKNFPIYLGCHCFPFLFLFQSLLQCFQCLPIKCPFFWEWMWCFFCPCCPQR